MVVAIHAQKIAYMAVPKAACSSVKAGLAMIDPKVDTTLDAFKNDIRLIHETYYTMRFRLHRWQEYEGWWRFTVVRDPIKRLMSLYTDLVMQRNELSHSIKLKRPDAPLPIDPTPDFFFQNLAGYMREASVIKHHALPVRVFVGPKPLLFNRIYKLEDLDELAKDLTAHCGTKVRIPRLNASSEGMRVEDLKPKTRASLHDYLSGEYETLAGIYDNPL